MKIERWGSGLAMPIPDEIAEQLDIKPGDEVDVAVDNGQLRITVRSQTAVQAMINRMRANRRPLPADYKIDRAEANGFEE